LVPLLLTTITPEAGADFGRGCGRLGRARRALAVLRCGQTSGNAYCASAIAAWRLALESGVQKFSYLV